MANHPIGQRPRIGNQEFRCWRFNNVKAGEIFRRQLSPEPLSTTNLRDNRQNHLKAKQRGRTMPVEPSDCDQWLRS
jgi:hypothetical protein